MLTPWENISDHDIYIQILSKNRSQSKANICSLQTQRIGINVPRNKQCDNDT